MDENTLGKRLREIREQKGLSRQYVASEAGISMNSLYLYETKDRPPSAEIVSKLADVLEVSTDYLLGRTNEENPLYTDIGQYSDLIRKKLPVYDLKKVKNGILTTGKVDEKEVPFSFLNQCAYWVVLNNNELSPIVSENDYVLMIEKVEFKPNTIVLVNIDNILYFQVLQRYEINNIVLSDFASQNLVFEKDHKIFKLLSTAILYFKK